MPAQQGYQQRVNYVSYRNKLAIKLVYVLWRKDLNLVLIYYLELYLNLAHLMSCSQIEKKWVRP